MEYSTTTADFWVVDSHISNDAPKGGFRDWDSHSYNKTGHSTHLGYYGGEISGTRGVDNVEIGGEDLGRHNFVVATSINDEISHDNERDGVIGLRFGRRHKHKTYKNNFLRVLENDMDPVFTIQMNKNDTGTITFGEVDKQYENDIHYAPVSQKHGKWNVGGWFKEFTIGPQGSKPFHCKKCRNEAKIDTSSSLIYLHKSLVREYYKGVPDVRYNGQWWTIPCDGSVVLPDFTLYWSGDKYPAVIPGRNLGPFHTNANTCIGGIQQLRGFLGFSRFQKQVLGSPFVKQFFLVFDYQKDHTRIGLADLKDTDQNADEGSCPLADKSCNTQN